MVAVGVWMIFWRRVIAKSVETRLWKTHIWANPLYYLAVGYAVAVSGLIYGGSALFGFYK